MNKLIAVELVRVTTVWRICTLDSFEFKRLGNGFGDKHAD